MRVIYTSQLAATDLKAEIGRVIADYGITVPKTDLLTLCVESCADLLVTAYANGVFGSAAISLDWFNLLASGLTEDQLTDRLEYSEPDDAMGIWSLKVSAECGRKKLQDAAGGGGGGPPGPGGGVPTPPGGGGWYFKASGGGTGRGWGNGPLQVSKIGTQNAQTAWATKTGRAYDRRVRRFWRQFEGQDIGGGWHVYSVNRRLAKGVQPDVVFVNHASKTAIVFDVTSKKATGHVKKGAKYVSHVKTLFCGYKVKYQEFHWDKVIHTLEAKARTGKKYFFPTGEGHLACDVTLIPGSISPGGQHHGERRTCRQSAKSQRTALARTH